jgi:hypothetical protein
VSHADPAGRELYHGDALLVRTFTRRTRRVARSNLFPPVATGQYRQRLQNTVFGIEHGLAAAAAEQESSRVRPRNYFFAEFAFIRGEPAAKRYSDPTL